MKKSFAILLVIAIVFSFSSLAFADTQSINSAEASTMRLMRADGTVFLKDASGPLLAQEGMRLASGNVLSTEAKSRAGILLDDYKAVTLNEFSRASVAAEGKKLELNLEHGAMFFSVSKPLDADESYSIRTSTMVLGIRGTSGYVETLSDTESAVTLTSGHAVVSILSGGELPLGPGQRITIRTDASGTQFSSLNVTPYDFPGLLLSGLISDRQILDECDAQNGDGFKEKVLDAALYHALRLGDFSLFAGPYSASTPGFAELTLNPDGSTSGGEKDGRAVWNGSAPVSVTRTDDGAYHCVVLGTGTETPENYNPDIIFEYYNLYPFNAAINYVSSQSGSVEDAWFIAANNNNAYESFITASYTSSPSEGATPSSSTIVSTTSSPVEEATPSSSAVPSYPGIAEEIVYSPSITGAYPETVPDTSVTGTSETSGTIPGSTPDGTPVGTTGSTPGSTPSGTPNSTTGSTPSGTPNSTTGDYNKEIEDLINSINDGSYFDGLFNGTSNNNQTSTNNGGNTAAPSTGETLDPLGVTPSTDGADINPGKVVGNDTAAPSNNGQSGNDPYAAAAQAAAAQQAAAQAAAADYSAAVNSLLGSLFG